MRHLINNIDLRNIQKSHVVKLIRFHKILKTLFVFIIALVMLTIGNLKRVYAQNTLPDLQSDTIVPLKKLKENTQKKPSASSLSSSSSSSSASSSSSSSSSSSAILPSMASSSLKTSPNIEPSIKPSIKPNIKPNIKPSITENQQYQWQAWISNFSRWTQLCTHRKERRDSMFYGCRGRLWAIQGQWALLRTKHLLTTPSISIPHFTVADWQKADHFKPIERTWRLAFLWELLHLDGDATLVDLLQKEVQEVYQYWLKNRCSIGTACPVAVYHLLKITNQPWHKIIKTNSALEGLSKLEWSTIHTWAQTQAQHLIQVHTNAHLQADHQRGSAESWWTQRALLAAQVLSKTDLLKWWSKEKKSHGFNLEPLKVPLAPRQLGIHFQRAWGLGILAYTLNDTQLIKACETHITVAMHIYKAYQRKYRSYAYRVPAWGIMALSELLSLVKPWQQHFQPTQWKFRPQNPTQHLKALPKSGVRRTGMFSEMIVKEQGHLRSLFFIRPNGNELLESQVDFKHPEILQVAYTKEMLSAYAYVPKVDTALLVGVGGGGMIHALHAYHPTLHLDAVEIDPVVVEFAQDYFGITTRKANAEHGKTEVITQDGFDFLAKTNHRYDIIYMDAFLQPTEDTDSAGSPLKLKTLAFLKEVQNKLSTHGALVININEHAGLAKDIRTIRAAFPYSMIWKVPYTGNWIALGLKGKPQFNRSELASHAQSLQTIYKMPFSFLPMIERSFKTLQARPIP